MRKAGGLWVLALVIGCAETEPDEAYDDTAGEALTWKAPPDTDGPEGYRFAGSGTHVDSCTGNAKCPTMWALTPAPNSCGAASLPTEAYILHQRGVDWNGHGGEAELHGNAYTVAHKTAFEVTAEDDQSVIVQCCPVAAGGQFFAIKTCPDPCDAADGSCPSTYGPSPFGGCIASGANPTTVCDIQVVEAGWKDPHAPHDLARPSGEDKRVFDVYYRMSWSCNHNGVCSLAESCSSCPDDCAQDCSTP